MLVLLVDFGYYSNTKDILKLMKPLRKFIDSTHDRLYTHERRSSKTAQVDYDDDTTEGHGVSEFEKDESHDTARRASKKKGHHGKEIKFAVDDKVKKYKQYSTASLYIAQEARHKQEELWAQTERFHRTEENDIMVEAKLKALHVINSLLNFEEDLRLEVGVLL